MDSDYPFAQFTFKDVNSEEDEQHLEQDCRTPGTSILFGLSQLFLFFWITLLFIMLVCVTIYGIIVTFTLVAPTMRSCCSELSDITTKFCEREYPKVQTTNDFDRVVNTGKFLMHFNTVDIGPEYTILCEYLISIKDKCFSLRTNH